MYRCKLCYNVYITYKSARNHIKKKHGLRGREVDKNIMPFDPIAVIE